MYRMSDIEYASEMFEIISRKDCRIIGLSGGSTPLKVYLEVNRLFIENNLDISEKSFVLVDERLNCDDVDRLNYRNILQVFPSIQSRLVYFNLDNFRSVEMVVDKFYNELISISSCEFSDLEFDFLLLGFGLDGHTAGIFDKSVPLNYKSGQFLHTSATEFAEDRLSLNLQTLSNSRFIHIAFRGREKSNFLNSELYFGTPTHFMVTLGAKIIELDG